MKVTSEMVKSLQKRIDVTYEEAERILLKTNGNIDRAEALLKNQQTSTMKKMMDEIERIYKELLTYYLKVTRKEKVVIDLPLAIVVGLFLIMTVDSKIWVAIVSIGIILISECTVNIYRVTKEKDLIVHNEPNKESRMDVKKKNLVGENESRKVEPGVMGDHDHDDDDDYYEITIEK